MVWKFLARNKRRLFWIGIAIIKILVLASLVKEPIKETWKSWHLPLSGRVIVIDPGHGGPDGGANEGDILEKDIALNISLYLRDYLQEQGAIVKMIRETDTDLAPKDMKSLRQRKMTDLKNRKQVINESEADLFISIHLNAMTNKSWSGSQVFYDDKLPENKEIAKILQHELKDMLKNTDRDARKNNDLFITRNAEVPGALAEVGFLSNDAERQLLQNKQYQNKVALALYYGINRYFANE